MPADSFVNNYADNYGTFTLIPHVEVNTPNVLTITTADALEDWKHLPAYLAPDHAEQFPHNHYASCSYCGVGDVFINTRSENSQTKDSLSSVQKNAQSPSAGCVKLEYSRMKKGGAYPIHIAPSIQSANDQRVNIPYNEAIERFAEMILEYLNPESQILIYACGQVDYFAIFAMQEVFRLLGVRNLTGNAEHCLNAGAVHNEMLTGQEGPFVTIDQALTGDNKFYILNGWNGFITHPPMFNRLSAKQNVKAVLFDVMLTETGQALQNKLGDEKIGLIKPAGDPHIALAVAQVLLKKYASSLNQHFIEHWSDRTSFENFKCLALEDTYSPESVATRIAAEPRFETRIQELIYYIADMLADPAVVPVVIPSVGLSQSTGVVAHCLWACTLAMLGKFGLDTQQSLLGGVLRLPGQINAESEVQGLSRKYFMGRIPMSDAVEAARRMQLPDDAYAAVLADEPIAALDYSEPSNKKQLFLFFGTQFESNMPNRQQWLRKLTMADNKVVVIDPIPDTWSLSNAQLIIPSPPHPATAKLYQNGEWRLSLSVPQKKASPETRSDATIIYDLMEKLIGHFKRDKQLLIHYPHLLSLLESGYLEERFCSRETGTQKIGGLARIQNEVSRVQLFERIQYYLHNGSGPLYCSFDKETNEPVRWEDLLNHGALIYGGVGRDRFKLDYGTTTSPFADIYRRERKFIFFTPTENDLELTDGLVLNSGRSSLSDNRRRIQFATKSFNSGKATPVDDMPPIHPVYVSLLLAAEYELITGDWIRIWSSTNSRFIELPVVVSDRIFGKTLYTSFHRSKAQGTQQLYLNDVTDSKARCAYSSQVKLKIPRVWVEKISVENILFNYFSNPMQKNKQDAAKKISLWDGSEMPFVVQRVIREADGCTSFQLIPDNPRRITFSPGQYCVVHLTINGRRQSRAYSISSSPLQDHMIEITVKRVEGGIVSNWLPDNVIAGDSLHLATIGGEFYLTPQIISEKMLFIGAGSGVTPLISMLRWLVQIAPNADVDFYMSVRSLADVVFAQELIQIETMMPNFNLWIVPTSKEYESSPEVLQGRICADKLQRVSPDCVDRKAYICGPEGFMASAEKILLQLGQSPVNIVKESFGVERKRPQEVSLEALQVSFMGTDINLQADGSKTLLELAEENNVPLNSACRSGMCGACLVKVEGDTCQETSDQLSEEQLAEGYRLACVCYPKGHCQVSLV